MKPTSGPWRATKKGATIFGMMDKKEVVVAHINDLPSRLENATLIAAALDLLEACCAAYDHILYEGGYEHGRNKELHDKLFAAIAKAEARKR